MPQVIKEVQADSKKQAIEIACLQFRKEFPREFPVPVSAVKLQNGRIRVVVV